MVALVRVVGVIGRAILVVLRLLRGQGGERVPISAVMVEALSPSEVWFINLVANIGIQMRMGKWILTTLELFFRVRVLVSIK